VIVMEVLRFGDEEIFVFEAGCQKKRRARCLLIIRLFVNRWKVLNDETSTNGMKVILE